MTNSQRLHAARENRTRRRSGFTLIEVLIATVILGLGLIGLAAVFPAVISQQQRSQDLANAVAAAENGEAILNNRLARFADALTDLPNNSPWVRINAYDPPDEDAYPYLQAPSFGSTDLRLRVPAEYEYSPQYVRDSQNTFDLEGVLRSPMAQMPAIRVYIQIQGRVPFVLTDSNGDDEFEISGKGGSRFDKNGVNFIDRDTGDIGFNLYIGPGETLTSIRVEYSWLNDRILAQNHRLFPRGDRARYAWDMAMRKSADGLPQYTMFVYKFEGPADKLFMPEIPSSYGNRRSGMLRRANGTIVREGDEWFLQVASGSELNRVLEPGVYVLPEGSLRGPVATGPVKVLRLADNSSDDWLWQLEGAIRTVEISANGQQRFVRNMPLGSTSFWYMPLEITSNSGEQGEVVWRIKPLFATVRQAG